MIAVMTSGVYDFMKFVVYINYYAFILFTMYRLMNKVCLLCPPTMWGGGGGGGGILILVRIPLASRSLLSALYLLIEWTYFSQTYTNISVGGGKY